jgi:hypothetical protein
MIWNICRSGCKAQNCLRRIEGVHRYFPFEFVNVLIYVLEVEGGVDADGSRVEINLGQC